MVFSSIPTVKVHCTPYSVYCIHCTVYFYDQSMYFTWIVSAIPIYIYYLSYLFLEQCCTHLPLNLYILIHTITTRVCMYTYNYIIYKFIFRWIKTHFWTLQFVHIIFNKNKTINTNIVQCTVHCAVYMYTWLCLVI